MRVDLDNYVSGKTALEQLDYMSTMFRAQQNEWDMWEWIGVMSEAILEVREDDS